MLIRTMPLDCNDGGSQELLFSDSRVIESPARGRCRCEALSSPVFLYFFESYHAMSTTNSVGLLTARRLI